MALWNIRQIRHCLTTEATQTIVHAFVTANLDYCNSLMFGISKQNIQRLQHVQNAVARAIFEFNLPKFCNITGYLKEFHWLPVSHRLMFKIALLVFKCLHGMAPNYLRDLIQHLPDVGVSLS